MVYKIKNKIFPSILLMAGAFLIANTEHAGAADGHSIGIVTADEVRVQSEPGKHGLLQKNLKRGSKIKIIKRRQGWIQVLHDGEVGFIKNQAQTFKIVSNKAKTDRENQKKPRVQQQQLNEYEKRKEYISREIKQGQLEVEAFTQKESDTIQRLNQVELALNKSQQKTTAIRKEIKKFEDAIGDASSTSDKLRKQIRANEIYVAQRLVALYKMNWLGRRRVPCMNLSSARRLWNAFWLMTRRSVGN
jgi:hypothetical protein